MTRTLYAIKSWPHGHILDVCETREEARDTIEAYEEQDIDDCVYSPGNYYISEVSIESGPCRNCAYFEKCRELDEPMPNDPSCIMFARKEIVP